MVRAGRLPSRARASSRVRGIVVVGLGFALFGPGLPVPGITSIGDLPEPRNSDVAHAPDNMVGSASVTVDLPDGTWGRAAEYRSTEGVPVAGKRTALIVGINRAKGGRPLPGSVTDATNLRNALIEYGFPKKNITVLLEDDATRSRIREELDRLAVRTPKTGLAVFAVATHTRRHGGENELLTVDGLRISASELAGRLGRVRSRMWVALPTCYAGGYNRAGIVGPNRIATFASSADERTYQLGSSGSYLFIHMVREAMLKGRASGSVEEAFHYAKNTLEREAPERVPSMSDGIDGELVLGPPIAEPVVENDGREWKWNASDDFDEESAPYPARDPAPSASPRPREQGFGPRLCGNYSVRC
jgi:hypothetical protein